ncbi:hypothetical protein CANARDRAFT_27732 [[Candida] arabinofermentans NRRL YB-2248]|uniref:Uncharacterized protein n=1 Tax=[Candida] arabinofermentans NRRL YB-2248 TaxID=983967 RepID=A0A1E4T457_9ASCO|nr:hypothetical protein CANARDRAFT_27732 [[Candida] arabinofermentans NRRL YB-2248]
MANYVKSPTDSIQCPTWQKLNDPHPSRILTTIAMNNLNMRDSNTMNSNADVSNNLGFKGPKKGLIKFNFQDV